MYFMDEHATTFLYDYLNSNAPTGNEIKGQRIWLQYIKPFVDTFFWDAYGNAVGVINPKAPYKVVIEAHADEIAWYINYIDENGYMYVIRNGGSDYEIAPSMHAKIHTQEHGALPAVFGWPAIHTRRDDKEKQRTPNVETVILDAGCTSKEEVLEKGINIGDIVTFDQDLRTLNSKFWVGRGLDNRIGGFAIAQVARKIAQNQVTLPFGLYIVNAVQEEIGHKGAGMIAERIQPNVVLVTDVCHCTSSPLYNKKKHGDTAAGKGPVLGVAPSTHPKLRKMLVKVARQQDIPFQLEASSYTGTDADMFAYKLTGIPSALMSTPLKYMHTTVEMVAQKDVGYLIEWFYHAILALDPTQSFDWKLDLED